MKEPVSVATTLCTIGIAASAFAAEPGERCDECPRVSLVSEEDLVHVVSEDDRDDPEDLSHRLRVVIGGEPGQWTEWNPLASYRVRTDVTVTVEAQSRDLEGFVGTGVIEVDPPPVEEGSIGPSATAENGREDKRWSDDATTPDDGSRQPEPEIEPYSVGDDPWDVDPHGECPPPESCSSTPDSPPSWPSIALLLLVSAGLLRRGSRMVHKS